MRIALVHAYSTTNSGDGLLVDEARAIAKSAFPDASISLIALDPASFDAGAFERVLHPLTGTIYNPSTRQMITRWLVDVLRGTREKEVLDLVNEADVVLAVGGGYLRAKRPVEAAKMLVAHGSQLLSGDRPTIYLPQSIGPLRFGTKGYVQGRLSRHPAVFVRDERSLEGLEGLSNVSRMPDMALLGLPAAMRSGVTRTAEAGPALVARALPGSKRVQRLYASRLGKLLESFPDMELLLQAGARGNNDAAFYSDVFPERETDLRSLKSAVAASATKRPGAVISVRLHGALEAVRSGVPSIHLSYERKGWGAFGDLGISPYVHNVFDFDVERVVEQTRELLADASDYWESVDLAIPALEEERARLVNVIRSAPSKA